MLFWILFLAPFVLFYIYLKRINQYWVNKNVPSVKPWLMFGNMGKVIFRLENQPEMIQEIYNAHDSRYVGLHFFLSPVLMIKDVNLLKQIGIKEFDHFVDHDQGIDDEMDPIFGKNLFSLKGEKWRHMRSALSPAFTGSKMRGMFMLISECAKEFTNYFEEKAKPNEPTTIELKDIFSRFANDVIASAAFGIQCNSLKEKKNDFYLMGKDITDFDAVRSLKFFGYKLMPRVMKSIQLKVFNKKTMDFFHSIIKNNIKMREEQGIIRPDMIHLLLEARKGKLKYEDNVKDDGTGFATVEESEVGKQQVQQEHMSDDDITAQALIFFFAGFDTISTGLCHTVYELALNEDIQERLQREIDETLEECNGKVTYDAILKMKYLDMVFTEGLRKWPPVTFIDRACTDDFTIQPERPGEHPIILKKGDLVWIPMYGLHRDPKYFPNPEKYDPERFSDENKGKIVPHSYVPFGIGPRNCIGSRFALLEAKTLLFHMLSKFSFVVISKTEIPITLTKSSFSMNAANGFWLGLKLRNQH